MFGIISHVSVGCEDPGRAVAFYDAIMPVIGAKRIMSLYRRLDGEGSGGGGAAAAPDAADAAGGAPPTAAATDNTGALDPSVFKEMGAATEPTTCPADQCAVVAVAYGKFAPEFWVQGVRNGRPASAGNGAHYAFSAKSAKVVDAWHAAAVAAGGVCDGPPGPRPQYGKQYYGAFVVDPDGHRIECMYWDMGWLGYCAVQ